MLKSFKFIYEYIKKWFFISIWIFFWLIVFYNVYAQISSVSPWSPLTAELFNKIISKLNSIDYNTGTNVLNIDWSIKLSNSNLCDSTTKWAIRNSTDALQVCDWANWLDLKSFWLWTSSNPASSCLQIAQNNPTAQNNLYWIKIWSNVPTQLRCDISGWGWTLAARIWTNNQHQVTTSYWTLSIFSQANVWKLSDADINAIPKTNFKLECWWAYNTIPWTCPFSATSQAVWLCNPWWWNTYSRLIWLANRPNVTPSLIWWCTNWNAWCWTIVWCYANWSWWNSWRLWLK